MAKKGSGKKAEYRAALAGKKIPVLTLDNKWHKLFTQTESSKQIDVLAEQVNALLREQGRINQEIKEIKVVKKRLMDTIMNSMNENGTSPETEKKLDESRRLIEECNDKLDEYQDASLSIPEEIRELNYQLMMETMDICYKRLQENTKEITEINQWVTETRIELKKQLLKKQEAEIMNHNLYSYMHDIFGADVLEIFDMEHAPEGKKPQLKSQNTEKNEK